MPTLNGRIARSGAANFETRCETFANNILTTKCTAHSAATCVESMKVVVATGKAHNIRKEKLTSGMANVIEEGLIYLGALVNSHHGDQATHGEAYVTTSDSESLAEKLTRRHEKREGISSRRHTPSRSPSCFPLPPPRCRNNHGHSKRCTKISDDGEQPKNDCRHCKKFGHNNAHPTILESKCNWNKKSKPWRQSWCVTK